MSICEFSDADFDLATKLTGASLQGSNVVLSSAGDALLLLDMARAMRVPLLSLVRSVAHYENGEITWRSSFILGLMNASGRVRGVKFECRGSLGDKTRAVRVLAVVDGAHREGPWADISRVTDAQRDTNQWWNSDPEMMLEYRAINRFAQQVVPELLYGMTPLPTQERKIVHVVRETVDVAPTPAAAADTDAETPQDAPSQLTDTASTAVPVTSGEASAAPAKPRAPRKDKGVPRAKKGVSAQAEAGPPQDAGLGRGVDAPAKSEVTTPAAAPASSTPAAPATGDLRAVPNLMGGIPFPEPIKVEEDF